MLVDVVCRRRCFLGGGFRAVVVRTVVVRAAVVVGTVVVVGVVVVAVVAVVVVPVVSFGDAKTLPPAAANPAVARATAAAPVARRRNARAIS